MLWSWRVVAGFWEDISFYIFKIMRFRGGAPYFPSFGTNCYGMRNLRAVLAFNYLIPWKLQPYIGKQRT
jgi:hypothetical protein